MTKNYKDITIEWIENATPNTHKVKNRLYFKHKNKKYYVDKKNVVLDYTKKEKEITFWLENNFGGKIYMLPRINYPEGIQTADYLFRKEYWDLKEINGKSNQALYHAIYKKQSQSKNFIFNIINKDLTLENIYLQIDKLFNRKDTSFILKIIIIKDNEYFIYKRK